MGKGGDKGIGASLGEGLGFGAVGLFGSTTRNTCTAEDKGFFCQTSRITGLIGSVLSLLLMLFLIYVLGSSFIRTNQSGGRRKSRTSGKR